MSTETLATKFCDAADLLAQTIELLTTRAPSIVADAATELRDEVLTLHFADGSHLTLLPDHNRIVVRRSTNGETPTVECSFSDRALQLLFDLEKRPAELLGINELDARGSTSSVLASWRTFQLLAQRSAGLRAVQALWHLYRQARRLDPLGGASLPKHAAPSARVLPDAAALLRGTEAVATRSASVATTRVLWDGKNGNGWWTFPGPKDADLFEFMDVCHRRSAEEIERIIPRNEPRASLYDLMLEYPLRGGKGLRPTLCLATCGAFGGRAEDALRTAAAVEMFHNAFLIHDDIEDESVFRRGERCLHLKHGVPLSINAGDGLNLQAIETVLSNIQQLGLARTLALINEVIHMCKQTIQGQAVELGWIRAGTVPRDDEDYLQMVTQKTGWYTCMSPCRLGAIVAGHTRARELDIVARVFHPIGIAFQIQDDVLNLIGDESIYGKESLGDLLEGKRTLLLIHLMRTLPRKSRADVREWLSLPRAQKDLAGARRLLAQLESAGSIEYGRAASARFAAEGAARFESQLAFLPESEEKAVLRQVVHYANTRLL